LPIGESGRLLHSAAPPRLVSVGLLLLQSACSVSRRKATLTYSTASRTSTAGWLHVTISQLTMATAELGLVWQAVLLEELCSDGVGVPYDLRAPEPALGNQCLQRSCTSS